jgi:hypothetical protein
VPVWEEVEKEREESAGSSGEGAGRLPAATRGGGAAPTGRFACNAFGTVEAIKVKLPSFSSCG